METKNVTTSVVVENTREHTCEQTCEHTCDETYNGTPETFQTEKFRWFVREPMGTKHVSEISGIGQVFGKRLARKGYDKAYMLLGQFLLLKLNQDDFVCWLETVGKITTREAKECARCLKLWCDMFL